MQRTMGRCRWWFAAALCAAVAWSGAVAAAEGARPNVLFIAVDDLNHWVGHLGRNKQTKTPNIDRLAKMGVSFSRAYCAAPVCNPSRTALMSGRRPGETGIYDNGQYWRQAVTEDQTLETQFRKAGYKVSGAGKIYHGDAFQEGYWDESLGKHKGEGKLKFDSAAKNDGVGGIKFAPLDASDADLQDHETVDYAVERLAAPKQDKPFFLAVGLHKPHMPWNVPKKYYDLHPLDQIELPPHREGDLDDVPAGGVAMAKPKGDHADILESGRWKEAVQGYLAAISYCDAEVGRLLDAYEKSPAREQTIVVFWGDHGWHLGEKQHWRKFALWEEATRAPLIWIVPGLTKPGECARTVDHMSIYPTLCDLCGLPTPAHVRGPSIRPLLADPKAAWDRPAVTTFKRNNHAIRNEGWRYIRYADGGEELYDETADPYEWKNLAGDPAYADTKAALAKHLPQENVPAKPDRDGAAVRAETKKAAKKAAKTDE